MLDGEREALGRYVDLIGSFVDGTMTAPEFEDRYTETYLHDPQEWSEASFALLDRLFADVDYFVEDDDLREKEKGDLDAAELREAARTCLDGIRTLLAL